MVRVQTLTAGKAWWSEREIADLSLLTVGKAERGECCALLELSVFFSPRPQATEQRHPHFVCESSHLSYPYLETPSLPPSQASSCLLVSLGPSYLVVLSLTGSDCVL